ncbi:hypothetical protein GCM10011371_00780 [Novosphingobium marinum]|uniref:AcrR family transcriptional regulator n=1 Tax=Novosphingobium marinum TaxID=1514948 RepID=A0A7Z0BTZ2_9SPHN|nr:TetR/AcrR family transcriptional regulator [Novosphingobium marinum]NYH93770.1 AcrR family transcriptional regulator [Novosphingobium marinum]GGC17171.1 hypothetical protein GCM10011371_00780 [Novosphingobium marinum]
MKPFDHSSAVLAKEFPLFVSKEGLPWQQRKSSLTREAILESAIDVLFDGGYAALSTNEVARRARLSRGAMHHHFASRTELVLSLTEYVFYKRMRYFLDDYLSQVRESDEGDWLAIAEELHWQSVKGREYTAYLHLAVAARSDSELAAVFDPAQRHFQEIWHREMRKAFSNWGERADKLRIASEFAEAVHIGTLLKLPATESHERSAALRAMLLKTLRDLYGSG